MTARLLLDSNVVIRHINGTIDATSLYAAADTVYISPIVLGECLAGLRHTNRDRNRRAKLEMLLSFSNVAVPPLTAATADHYARLWQYLTDTGRRIPSNDIWIAAHAMELAATLVTADRHFDAIPNLPVLIAPAPPSRATGAP